MISIIMGSISDLPKLQAGIDLLHEHQIDHEVKVVSAHRDPDEMVNFAKEAQGRGVKVIIAAAGGAAHLPGMVASMTLLPVIGVPIALKQMDGLDSLLSIVQMPKGVPVATVAIDNGFNGVLTALRIMALSDQRIFKILKKIQDEQKTNVVEMNQSLKGRP